MDMADVLLFIIAAGAAAFLAQFNIGLAVTGLSRDVSWGFYIAQLTFLVGVAASAAMVVLPYYLHNYKVFGKITILGEFTAVASVSMCGLFLFVDIGQSMRALNVFLYPSPQSIVLWDAWQGILADGNNGPLFSGLRLFVRSGISNHFMSNYSEGQYV